MRTVVRLCKECGANVGPSGCRECLSHGPGAAPGPSYSAHYAAPVQNNVVHLSVDQDDLVDHEPAVREPASEPFSSRALRLSLSFLSVSCGLAIAAAAVLMFSVAFLAMMRIR